MIKLPKLILASGSPRRSEILASVGWEFSKHVADIDETEHEGELPQDYVVRLAREKAEAVASHYAEGIVLGADTTVVIDNQIIGKPLDLADAQANVINAFRELARSFDRCGGCKGRPNALRNSEYTGKIRSDDRRRDQVSRRTRRPARQGRAYAVQAQAALFIEGIEGDYWNVVGLPISLVYRLFWAGKGVVRTACVRGRSVSRGTIDVILLSHLTAR